MEYVCLTLVGRRGEAEAAFKGRLVAFWTHMLRNKPDDYEQVYAEAVAFEDEGGRVGRRYMVAPGVVPVLAAELRANEMDFLSVDVDELYSKAEASASDWFQIEH